MTTFQYPNGTALTSTALNEDQAQAMLALATCQMLGIVPVPLSSAMLAKLPPSLVTAYSALLTVPLQVTLTLVVGQFICQASSTLLLYQGQLVVCAGLPDNTQISGFGPGNQVYLTNQSTVNAANVATITDPECFAKVRVGWQQEGQPAWNIATDVCALRCEPLETEYGRMRDSVQTGDGDTATFTDVYTRAWRVYWTFLGPNSTDRARAVRSALITIQQFADLLASANWYVNPNIGQPQRVPELFEGRWWPRTDLYVDFNEQITETYTTETVVQVPVSITTSTGQTDDLLIPQGD